MTLSGDWAGAQHSQSPMEATGGAVMGDPAAFAAALLLRPTLARRPEPELRKAGIS